MTHGTLLTVVFFRTIVLSLIFLCDSRPLDGYAFTVYTTKLCPRNTTEWLERSTALNCTWRNAYMCVPNENITELLEFCYSLPQIQIGKGLCMFLYKRTSIIDAYECSHFTEGCPISNYRSKDVHQYQSCVVIANGCFLADPSCDRSTRIYNLERSIHTATIHNTTTEILLQDSNKKADLIWRISLSVITAIVFISVFLLSSPCISKLFNILFFNFCHHIKHS